MRKLLIRNSFVLILLFIFSADVFAKAPSHTLFAVDVSLSANDKNTAFDIIREATLIAPETHSVGLTLFDDTVRGFVAPAGLDEQQIKALHQTMAAAPVSVRSTSNLAVGIERAIDAFAPEGGANLVVFSRGVIDTKSQDPRAQFIKWLDQVLLPQAAKNDIAVSLVVQQIKPIHKQINDIFAKTDMHRIIVSTADTRIAPELISLLNIPERNYGQLQSAAGPSAESLAADNQENLNKQADSPNTQESSEGNVLPDVRLILLAVCVTLLFGILAWRYRRRRVPKDYDHNAHSSSSYLPLTQKPGETMDQYIDRETDLENSQG